MSSAPHTAHRPRPLVENHICLARSQVKAEGSRGGGADAEGNWKEEYKRHNISACCFRLASATKIDNVAVAESRRRQRLCVASRNIRQ